ncbi:hypothetical protein [Caballeronia sp. LZ065]|uniref:hypothetical protein n=1 Tax=Caballeronia sp. LZ065 TaxID=3038571 RepID=UPI00286B6EEA|nr:hypothetical protein [Caballeronia sp. LZ065]
MTFIRGTALRPIIFITPARIEARCRLAAVSQNVPKIRDTLSHPIDLKQNFNHSRHHGRPSVA